MALEAHATQVRAVQSTLVQEEVLTMGQEGIDIQVPGVICTTVLAVTHTMVLVVTHTTVLGGPAIQAPEAPAIQERVGV